MPQTNHKCSVLHLNNTNTWDINIININLVNITNVIPGIDVIDMTNIILGLIDIAL